MAPIQESFRERPDVEMGLTTRESVELFQDAYDKAVDEAHEKLQQSSTGGDMSSKNMKMKLTLDLKNRHLNQIPKEVIAIIEQDVERYDIFGFVLPNTFNEFRQAYASIPIRIHILIFSWSRLQLAHNQLCHIAIEFASCSALRYLNLRDNIFKEVPKVVREVFNGNNRTY